MLHGAGVKASEALAMSSDSGRIGMQGWLHFTLVERRSFQILKALKTDAIQNSHTRNQVVSSPSIESRGLALD